MFALLERRDPTGPLLVHELFVEDPKLHGSLHVVSVPDGVVVGWMQKPDGSFGPSVPDLAAVKADRIRTLRFDCFHAIVGGFTSSALGSAHSYGSTDTDRENIDRAAMASLTGQKDPNWTAQIPHVAPSGAQTFAAHSAAQVHQVSADLHAHIESARLKLDALSAKVAAAATVAEVQAIVWA